jgi:hypothetical protein
MLSSALIGATIVQGMVSSLVMGVIATGAIGPAFADTGVRNGLPPCRMDSFVYEAKQNYTADLIYGDEGDWNQPPFFGFTEQHRIDRGIWGVSNQGLTTGHSEYLPDAWGGDEFIGKPEWSQSGPNSGQYTTYQEPATLPPDVIPPQGSGF